MLEARASGFCMIEVLMYKNQKYYSTNGEEPKYSCHHDMMMHVISCVSTLQLV